MKCMSEFDPVTLGMIGCSNEATRQRRTRPWPPDPKRKWVTYHLCDACARLWDEARREAQWEARVS